MAMDFIKLVLCPVLKSQDSPCNPVTNNLVRHMFLLADLWSLKVVLGVRDSQDILLQEAALAH